MNCHIYRTHAKLWKINVLLVSVCLSVCLSVILSVYRGSSCDHYLFQTYSPPSQPLDMFKLAQGHPPNLLESGWLAFNWKVFLLIIVPMKIKLFSGYPKFLLFRIDVGGRRGVLNPDHAKHKRQLRPPRRCHHRLLWVRTSCKGSLTLSIGVSAMSLVLSLNYFRFLNEVSKLLQKWVAIPIQQIWCKSWCWCFK